MLHDDEVRADQHTGRQFKNLNGGRSSTLHSRAMSQLVDEHKELYSFINAGLCTEEETEHYVSKW
jgi:hypothetical protein